MNDLDEGISLRGPGADALLDDLEIRCSTDVAAVREAACRSVRADVAVLPANVCERDDPLTVLRTTDVKPNGLTGIAARPVMVGSVFSLRFDRTRLDASPALAVCDRCTMLGDDSFELRMRFAQPVDLAPVS